jgi:DNA polymerase III subunit delta'
MIIGHKDQREKLSVLSKKNSIPHALLFTGPESIGKRTTALWFLKKINCKDKKAPCLSCQSCREIEEKTHPDILEIYPEEKELKIKQIQDLTEKFSYRSLKAGFKGALIDDAHLMNQSAQNAILKTLEEPTEDTVIILITSYPYLLLPTILSRVFEIKFYFVKQEEIEENLDNKGVAEISYGRPGKASEYFQNSSKLKEARKIKEDVRAIFEEDLVSKFSKIKKIVEEEKEKDFLISFLETLKEKINDGIRDKKDVKKYINITKETENIIYLSTKTNINMRLALEKIIIKI